MVVVIVIVHTTSDISSVWPVGCCRDMIFLVWNEIYYLLQLVVPEHIKVGQTKEAHEKGITFPLHSKWILWQMACNPGWIISFKKLLHLMIYRFLEKSQRTVPKYHSTEFQLVADIYDARTISTSKITWTQWLSL